MLRNPVLNPKSEPVKPTPVLFERLQTEPVQIEFLETAEVEPAKLGKIEPAGRKPELEELIGSKGYKKKADFSNLVLLVTTL